MSRPAGVTILCVVMIVAGIAFAVLGITAFFAGSVGAVTAGRTSGGMAALLAALGAAAGVIFLLFGALHAVLAAGIFRLRNPARVLVILLFGLIGAGACLGTVATLLRYSPVALAWNVSLLAVAAGVIWYLMRPDVKRAFNT